MTIEQQALALVNEVRVEVGAGPMVPRNINPSVFMALCRALERHEADKAAWQQERQEVSEAAAKAVTWADTVYTNSTIADILSRFIIAPPVDPLVEVLTDMGIMHVELGKGWAEVGAEAMRAALAKHGLQITGVET